MEIYKIIPDDKKVKTKTTAGIVKAAVLVHLFYEEQVEYSQKYLEKLPDNVDIVIISSKETILDRFQDDRYMKIKKENRGRDISALLIAARSVVFRYKYVCFLHDKKEKNPKDREYVDLWRKNIWDNMLATPEYVHNILDLFEDDGRLGIVVPLPPHLGDKGVWLKGNWGGTFEHVKNLAREIGITVDISYENPPFTYSTVFWARTIVLKKLFSKEWKYTDFPNEPLRDYGEINHAVERIFQYLAEDAGYKTKVVMSAMFAASFITQLKDEINRLWDYMGSDFGIRSYREMDDYSLRMERVKQFKRRYTDIYLYGAGRAGGDCLKMCFMLDVKPVGILVTDRGDGQTELDGIRILPLADFTYSCNTGVLISVYSDIYRSEIKRELDKIGFHEYMEF